MDRTDDDAAKRALLSTPRKIAVLGASPDPERASHRILVYLRSKGHDAIPVNPMAPEVAGVPCVKDLQGAVDHWGAPPDIVDVFRSPHHLPPIVDETIRIGAGWLWCQLGVVHESTGKAVDAGVDVVVDRCILVESERLA